MASLCTSIYYTWRKRNGRLFQVETPMVTEIAKNIIHDLKLRFHDLFKVLNRVSVIKWCNSIGIKPNIVIKGDR